MHVIPKVSIIVPIYNVEKYLTQCLESLVHQTLHEIEIICVNDGSTDNSLEIIRRYAEKDNRIVVINKENRGYGHSMNQGLQAAKGTYIGIVESDDFADAEMFEGLFKAASENDAEVVKSNYFACWSESEKRNEFVESLAKVTYRKIVRPADERSVFFVGPNIWSAIYKRTFLNENNIMFTETPGASYQDTAFNFKVWACAEKAYFVPEAYIYYRRDNENSSVNSAEKVFCVCDEYAEIERFLRERPEKYRELIRLKNRLKYETYRWNLDRLDTRLKLDFLRRMSIEFRSAKDADELERRLYNFLQWKMIQEIIEDPDRYYKKNYEYKNSGVSNERKYVNGKNLITKTIGYCGRYGVKETARKIKEKICERSL